jgi:hypothetical protein
MRFFDQLSKTDVIYLELERLRKAVRETLLRRLAVDETLAHISPSDILSLSTLGEYRLHVVKKPDGQIFFVRSHEGYWDGRGDEARKAHEQALHQLASLPACPYLLVPDFFSTHPYLILGTSYADLHACDDPSLSWQESLETMRDALRGAAFLADHHLVLEDIHLGNIGRLVTRDGKRRGVLFDLEGLTIQGTKLVSRCCGSSSHFPLNSVEEVATPIEPWEMAYQFGASLQELVTGSFFQSKRGAGKRAQEKALLSIRDALCYNRVSFLEAADQLQACMDDDFVAT